MQFIFQQARHDRSIEQNETHIFKSIVYFTIIYMNDDVSGIQELVNGKLKSSHHMDRLNSYYLRFKRQNEVRIKWRKDKLQSLEHQKFRMYRQLSRMEKQIKKLNVKIRLNTN